MCCFHSPPAKPTGKRHYSSIADKSSNNSIKIKMNRGTKSLYWLYYYITNIFLQIFGQNSQVHCRKNRSDGDGGALTWMGKARAGRSRKAAQMKSRALCSCMARWGQRAPACARPERGRYIYQRSLLCPAGTPCPSQWESQQETNFCWCLKSRFSPRASPGAALSPSIPSLHGHSCCSLEPAQPHACAAMRFLCFFPEMFRLLPHRKPLFLDNSPENWIVRISESKWLFSLCHWEYRRPWQYVLLWNAEHMATHWAYDCVFPETAYGSIITDFWFFLSVSWCITTSEVSPVFHYFWQSES